MGKGNQNLKHRNAIAQNGKTRIIRVPGTEKEITNLEFRKGLQCKG